MESGLMSIIISSYNRKDLLKETLIRLAGQETGGQFDYEVIVTDNNSNDGTDNMVQELTAYFRGRLRYRTERRQGKSYALNSSIRFSRGNIIVLTDDDVIASRTWLLSLWQCFKRYRCDAVGGRVLPLFPPGAPDWADAVKGTLNGPWVTHDYGTASREYEEGRMLPFIGANMAFTRECLEQTGLFRTDLGAGMSAFGEDTELYRRLQKSKKKIVYCGRALVMHVTPSERLRYRYLAQWSVRYGRSAARRYATGFEITAFGIPWRKYRTLVVKALGLSAYAFNRKSFLRSWQDLFTTIGEFIEYRNMNAIPDVSDDIMSVDRRENTVTAR